MIINGERGLGVGRPTQLFDRFSPLVMGMVGGGGGWLIYDEISFNAFSYSVEFHLS